MWGTTLKHEIEPPTQKERRRTGQVRDRIKAIIRHLHCLNQIKLDILGHKSLEIPSFETLKRSAGVTGINHV